MLLYLCDTSARTRTRVKSTFFFFCSIIFPKLKFLTTFYIVCQLKMLFVVCWWNCVFTCF